MLLHRNVRIGLKAPVAVWTRLPDSGPTGRSWRPTAAGPSRTAELAASLPSWGPAGPARALPGLLPAPASSRAPAPWRSPAFLLWCPLRACRFASPSSEVGFRRWAWPATPGRSRGCLKASAFLQHRPESHCFTPISRRRFSPSSRDSSPPATPRKGPTVTSSWTQP